jgi:hypothetical protein
MEQTAHTVEDDAADWQVSLAQVSSSLLNTEPARAKCEHVAATRESLIMVEIALSTLSPRRSLVTEAIDNVRNLLAGLVADVLVIIEGAEERWSTSRDSTAGHSFG